MPKKKIIKIIYKNKILNIEKHNELKNIPVVIMAGGQGTRMVPFTKILPKPLLYFDHFYRSSEFEGEFYSIKKFNDKNKLRKISDILELPEQLSTSWNKWLYLAKRLKQFINFKHPKFKSRIKTII